MNRREPSSDEVPPAGTGQAEEVSHVALSLRLELTARCNFHCLYCYADSGPHRIATLPGTLALRIIDEFQAQGGETIVISGGEPMLHSQWPRIARHAVAAVSKVCLATNGFYVRRNLEILAALPLRVLISLDGLTERTHECARGAGTFRPVLEGIERLARMPGRVCGLGLNVVVHGQNLTEVPDLIRFALDHRIDYVAFCVLKNQGRHRTSGLRPLNAIQRLWLHDFLDAKAEQLLDKLRIEGANCGHEHFLMARHGTGAYPCRLGRAVKVLPDGRLYCCDQAEHPFFCIGNVYSDTLVSALNSDALRRNKELVAERFLKTTVCRSCVIGDLCGGGCPSEALDHAGTLLAPDSNCDARQLYFISTALAGQIHAARPADAAV